MANIYNMSDTWDDGATTFTSIKMDVTDTASASDSLLLDLQVGGSSKFSVTKAGVVEIPESTAYDEPSLTFGAGTSGIAFSAGTVTNIVSAGIGVASFKFGVAEGLKMRSDYPIGWSNNQVNGSSDTKLYRDGVGILSQRNSTNAQTFNLYNTYTDASNYERARIGWSGNIFELAPQAAGTGTTRVIHISGLPTSNPGAGILWNNAGNVEVGT